MGALRHILGMLPPSECQGGVSGGAVPKAPAPVPRPPAVAVAKALCEDLSPLQAPPAHAEESRNSTLAVGELVEAYWQPEGEFFKAFVVEIKGASVVVDW